VCGYNSIFCFLVEVVAASFLAGGFFAASEVSVLLVLLSREKNLEMSPLPDDGGCLRFRAVVLGLLLLLLLASFSDSAA
jgi:hypothetical protein